MVEGSCSEWECCVWISSDGRNGGWVARILDSVRNDRGGMLAAFNDRGEGCCVRNGRMGGLLGMTEGEPFGMRDRDAALGVAEFGRVISSEGGI